MTNVNFMRFVKLETSFFFDRSRIVQGGALNLGLDRRLTEQQIAEVCALTWILEGFILGTGSDSIKWNINSSGVFSVKSCYPNLETNKLLQTFI